ncbi:hypothetical protein [Pseudoduganella armeniaca]|uniref:Uncharacterized protein n=1 Tax=Pseudoduganella armeniaca TaxID=2072590 RepID=A0A2R4CHI5_9BURK|nr:hypothetical protein [Pseudoduganella armeniaca]AVR98918.1 hypothetical protein C9I28_27325 [Pseudoduganella armeniaca]
MSKPINIDRINIDALKEHRSIVVIAGHYCIAPELEELSHTAESEKISFSAGVQVMRQLLDAGRTAKLCLWVNDIGIHPIERAEHRASYTIPATYQALMRAADLSTEHIEVVFESTIRNKASTSLKKHFRDLPEKFSVMSAADSSLIRCVNNDVCGMEQQRNAYVIKGPRGENLVVKDGPNPKCNLILATLFDHVIKRCGASAIVNIFNEIYVARIHLGLHVFDELSGQSGKVAFDNYFCSDTEISTVDFSDASYQA